MGTVLLTAVMVGNVLVAPQFCAGVRSTEQYRGMTYKAYLAEYALDVVAASKLQEQETLDAERKGLPNALAIGLQARAKAKASMAARHATNVKKGQVSLCKALSSNW